MRKPGQKINMSGRGQRDLKVRVKSAKGRKLASTLWLERQLNDPYVQRAQREGYRGRAAYKIMELDDKYRFLLPGAKVVDLGCAPGGWCQMAVERVNSLGERKYVSQEELDAYIKKSYVRGKIGVKRIQTIFADELGLHPSRREVENYLTGDLGLELRKRAPKKHAVVPSDDATKSELAQARESIGVREIEIDSKDARIRTMKSTSMDDAKEILRLKKALMDIRDKGRAPTDEEVEELLG